MPGTTRYARITVVWLLAGVVLGAAAAGCSSATLDRPRGHDEIAGRSVHFPGHGVTLQGSVFTPADSPRYGERRPAIVLLHGCGGMVDARGSIAPRHRDWAERFARWGFVALLVDSFGPRGIGSLCELEKRPIGPWIERTRDVYAALEYLTGRADVDAQSVFVLGWSHGGSTVLSVVRPDAPGRRAGGPRFKAAIAFYPGCTLPMQRAAYEPTMPTLILHGEADDWTPAAPCIALAERLRHVPFPLETITYPEAHHGFDQPGGVVRRLPNVFNPAAPGSRGAHIGPHHPSRLKAIEQVQLFVQLHR